MSFVVVVADTDSASISLVSGVGLETEEAAREALASWWAEQPAPVQAASRAYVLDLERLAPVLIVPLVAESPEIVGFLPEDPTRQTRQGYEETVELTAEETSLVEDVIVEATAAEVDAGVFIADDAVPPPPAVIDPVQDVVADEATMDSFIGEADEADSVLEDLSDEVALEEAAAAEIQQLVAAEAPDEGAAEDVEAEAEEVVPMDAEPVEIVEEAATEWPSEAEVAEDTATEDEAVTDGASESVADETKYYGSTGLAPVAGLADEAEPRESGTQEVDAGQATLSADVTPETVEVVTEEPASIEAESDMEWQKESGPEGELLEYATAEVEAAPVAPVEEPAAYEPAPESGEAAPVEPAASWPWEIEGDGGGAAGAVASDAPAPASEVREPLGAMGAQAGARAAHPVAGTAIATAADGQTSESETGAAEAGAGAYEPGSLDMDTYTCDDCVYESTCPKKGEETPATCGSFQWRAS